MTTAHLKQLGTVFRPGPDLGDLAWRRRHFDQRDFSICGITHTVSETMAMQVIGNLMIAPVQPWDALVCTTECVKGVIERLLADWADYLGARFEHDVQLPCRLPVIPLGVDSAAMAAKADDSYARTNLRETLGIKDGDIALLYAGRLNHVEKANPIPMYLAAEAAAANTGSGCILSRPAKPPTPRSRAPSSKPPQPLLPKSTITSSTAGVTIFMTRSGQRRTSSFPYRIISRNPLA